MNLFDWLKQINSIKSPSNTFSDDDWEQFNAYMVHRFISMNPNYLQLANLAQEFQPTDKKRIYEFYKEFIPKNNRFSKYIKSKSSNTTTELLQVIAEHYQMFNKQKQNNTIQLLAKADQLFVYWTHRGL